MAGRVAYYGGIVANSLVLNLDAAKRDSYPGIGTAWRDISGNGRNGTLVNGPTFNSGNGGSIVFDGVNDYATLGTINTIPLGIQNRTMMGWVQDNSITDYVGDAVPLFGYGNNATGQLFRLSVGGTTFNNRRFWVWTNSRNHISTFSIDRNIWNHVTVTVTTGVSFPRLTIYKNGVADSGSERDINTANGPFEIAEATSDPVYAVNFNGRVSQVLVYNRALTAQEVLQNYNATKTRFGL